MCVFVRCMVTVTSSSMSPEFCEHRSIGRGVLRFSKRIDCDRNLRHTIAIALDITHDVSEERVLHIWMHIYCQRITKCVLLFEWWSADTEVFSYFDRSRARVWDARILRFGCVCMHSVNPCSLIDVALLETLQKVEQIAIFVDWWAHSRNSLIRNKNKTI